MLPGTKVNDSHKIHMNNTCHESLKTYTSKTRLYIKGEKNFPQITESTQQQLLNIVNYNNLFLLLSVQRNSCHLNTEPPSECESQVRALLSRCRDSLMVV